MEVEIIRRLITVTTAKQSFRAGVVITFWQDIQIESSCRMLYSRKIRKWGRTFYTNFRISGITDTTVRYNKDVAYLMVNYLICNSLHLLVLLVNVHMYWAPVHFNLNLASRSFNRSCGLLRHWSQTLCFLIITFARLCNLQESNFSVVLLCSQVFESGIGELVVLRRPRVETPAHMYSPCTLCYWFCHKTALASHVA